MKIKSIQRSFYRIVLPALVLAALLVPAGVSQAQAIIKVSDTVNLRFGILLQSWADWQQIAGASAGTLGGYQQNLFIRRARILFAGNVAKGVSFFLDTENANLGKASGTTAKALGTGFQLLDAYGKWEIAPEFAIEGGLILIPLCRNCNTSAATLLTLDYGSYSFQENGPTQSTTGRDTGFQALGWALDGRFEYRIGAYQGARQTTQSKNAFRFTGRLAYNFLDKETGLQFYPGTYLAAKKVLAIGASYDTQKNYGAFGADIFYNQPIGKNALTLEVDYINYNPGFLATSTFFKQQDIMVFGGFYFAGPKLLPFVRFEFLEPMLATDRAEDLVRQQKFQAGMTYYPFGHNLNFKFAYTYLRFPNNSLIHSTNEYTIQMQVFYF